MFSKFLYFENPAVYDIMGKNYTTARQATHEGIIRRRKKCDLPSG
jgi:hypothetical protein